MSRSRCLLGLFALCSLVRGTLANLYDGDDYVVSFDEVTKFENQVAGGDPLWIIQFFSPDASSSQKLVQEYSQIAKITRGIIQVGAVDVSTEAGAEIAKTYGVKTSSSSSPTIMFFGDDATKPKKYTGKKATEELLQESIQTALDTLVARAGGTPKGSSGSSSSSSSGGKSKVVQLTGGNFEDEVLNNPLVSAVACK
jgi:hypothetical protein